MYKAALLSVFLFFTTLSHAQEPFKNRDGLVITPEKGEMSIGFDAVPFLKFMGSLFNDDNSAPLADFTARHPLTFTSVYVYKENTAIRSKVRLGLGVEKTDTLVPRIGSTNPNETVSNETKVATSNITLGAGLQKWRGKGRVRGFYGGELLIKISTEKTTYSYGNAMSSENQATRTKSVKPGNNFGFNLRGFVGVEYFFAAKASLSAEFGWGPLLNTKSRGEVETESWNGSSAEATVTESGKSSSFQFDNDNAGGSLNLNFYF
ncbi:MAG: hypothetical protein JNL88_05755 [Bacteroidia bacterium]|nr:hypothetical protein [Bacteroidia bacterium]